MCQAVTDLIESIALEETALSHILNAEGEKLQRVIGLEDVDFCQLMEVNESVANMVGVVSSLELVLKEKLESVSYTHLDVYKRQVCTPLLPWGIPWCTALQRC